MDGRNAWLAAKHIFTLTLLPGLNMLAVRIFGEVEFWFAIIKIVAIVGLHAPVVPLPDRGLRP